MDFYQININDIKEDEINNVKVKLPLRYKKASSFSFREGYLLSIGVGVLLLRAFPTLKEKNIYYNEYDKPFIKDDDYFSCSHSGEYTVLVKSKYLVGVDIEQIQNKPLILLNRFFEDERKWIEEDPATRYYLIWSLKESVVKAVGTGLATSPFSFSAIPLIKGESINVNGVEIFARTYKKDGYVISFATTNKEELYR